MFRAKNIFASVAESLQTIFCLADPAGYFLSAFSWCYKTNLGGKGKEISVGNCVRDKKEVLNYSGERKAPQNEGSERKEYIVVENIVLQWKTKQFM